MIGRNVSFLTKLAESSRARDSIVCVGLDPEPDLIPEMLGSGPQAALRFLRRVIRATSDYACAYKPNLAFYERYGSAAFDVLALTLQAIPGDIPVVLDAKRGDVPNTSAAYADALFDSFHADAVTVAPYLGMDSIEPFCIQGRYALVLARTSNPGAGDVQDLVVENRPLYEHVVERSVASFAADACGFVVGATYPEEARRIRELAPDRLFLMPGVVAGTAGDDTAAGALAGFSRYLSAFRNSARNSSDVRRSSPTTRPTSRAIRGSRSGPSTSIATMRTRTSSSGPTPNISGAPRRRHAPRSPGHAARGPRTLPRSRSRRQTRRT